MRVRIGVGLLIVCASAMVLGLRVSATPGIGHDWDGGGVNALWTTKENWVGDVAPVAGETLNFPEGAAQKTNTNDYPADTLFPTISFSGSTGGYNISGNRVATTGLQANNSTGQNFINFNILDSVTVGVAGAVGLGELVVNGMISGPGTLSKTGSGILRLLGSNTYTGVTTINGGFLQSGPGTTLGVGDGTPATGTVVNSGGSLVFFGDGPANEHITLNGAGQSGVGTLRMTNGGLATASGPIVLNDATVSVGVLSTTMVLNGPVTGPGRLNLNGNGNGQVTLGNSANSFAGGIAFVGTPLFLNATANNAIPSTVSLNIPNAGDLVDLNGTTQTVTGLTGAGALRLLLASADLTVNQATNTTFSGPLVGAGTFRKSGVGSLTLSGASGFTGTMIVTAGQLILTSDFTGVTVNLTGGTVGGSGTIGKLTATGGTVAPGTSPGILNVGDTTFNAATTFTVEINGTTPGTQYDRLNVSGAVNLGGATLNVLPGFVATIGDQFIIINNDGSDPIGGLFAGLGQGASFVAVGQTFTISYIGGDGNDVVLTAGTGAVVPTVGEIAMVLMFLSLAALGAMRVRRRHFFSS